MKIEAVKISLSVFLIILGMMSFVVIMTNTVIEKNIIRILSDLKRIEITVIAIFISILSSDDNKMYDVIYIWRNSKRTEFYKNGIHIKNNLK